jgi:hypothetical protein
VKETVSNFLKKKKILFLDLTVEKPSLGGLLTKIVEANMTCGENFNNRYILPIVSSARIWIIDCLD